MLTVTTPLTSYSYAQAQPTFRPGAQRPAALMDLHGVGFFALTDTLTGYGRTTGYDSLANARRAAYQLSVGATSPAAAVYSSGERFFVRALGTTPGRNPHEPAGTTVDPTSGPTQSAKHALSLLHFEGNKDAHFAWVADPRLVLVVDGATKIWAKDAHHPAPKA